MAFRSMPGARSALGRGMRNLPQYKDDKNRELCLLRLRKERERLVQERTRLKSRQDVIATRLAEIAREEAGVRAVIGGNPPKAKTPDAPEAQEPYPDADQVLVRY